MMQLQYKHLAIFTLLFLNCFISAAQDTEINRTDLKSYQNALELYDKEKYSAAIHAFEEAMEEINDPTSMVYEDSEFYKALCAINLFSRNAEYLLRDFLIKYPESARVKDAKFQLGVYNYRQKQWEEVIQWFDEIDPYDLSTDKRQEMYFKKGYAYFREDQLDGAKSSFYNLIDIPSEYYAPANYYYGHINYEQGNYETALKSFQKIATDEKFSAVVPYYVTQIYYNQKRYDSVITYASPLVEQEDIKRKPEIARLVGESHFNNEDYKEAIPYLELFVKESRTKTREDDFQLGYAYYKSSDPESAISYFKKTTYSNDSLAQVSNYLIAESYMDLDDKKAARLAYQNVYNLGQNQELAEESLFNFAKLSYELAYDPYNQAIDAFIMYLEKYPNAMRSEQAYEYLINIYLNSKNYRAAIGSLESTMHLDNRFKKVYQQLVYNLAVEQFMNGDYYASIEVFDKSLTQPEDKSLAALASYWKAEAYYREKLYAQAVSNYKEFIYHPRAILLPEFYLAHYGIAYSYFQKRDYVNASTWFRKFTSYKEADSLRTADALIRTGDCYFIQKQYLPSLDYYEDAIALNSRNTDYALYQYAVASGVLKRSDKKLETLQELEKNYPNSNYIDAVLYELGRTYFTQDNNDKALNYFQKVVNDYPHSSYKKKAQVDIGLIYYNQDQSEKALTVFKQVVKENPNYADSKAALRGIQNIYKENGNIDAYEAYVEGLEFMNVSDGSLDSLNYESTELQYMAGSCGNAIDGFQKYLNKFDNAIFYLNANFYLAECLYKSGNFPDALNHYTNVLRKPSSKFTEPSLAKAAYINYTTNQFQVAANQYKELYKIAQYPENRTKAAVGVMRSFYQLNDLANADSAAINVLNLDEMDESVQLQATFIHAKALDLNNQNDSARAVYQQVIDASKSEIAAEALYRTALSWYDDENYDTAEVVVFELVNFTPTYDEWLAKGLILLSDIYLAKDDPFQAKATLESIIENYEGDDKIKNEAQQKLNALIQENKPPEPEQEEEMEIDMNDIDDLDYELLYEEEQPVDEPKAEQE